MAIGIVKWFDCKKGFGFLLDDNGQDVFVHYSMIEGDGFRRLRDGEQVEYELGAPGPKGLSAVKVRRLEPEKRPHHTAIAGTVGIPAPTRTLRHATGRARESEM